jgi:succinate dehydrogenase / fumarate reductase, iron-sulfur subunit
MAHSTINLKLHVWRQRDAAHQGHFETHEMKDISTEMSFLEMLDILNEKLIMEKKDPVAFSHDCREGICGACGLVINGRPHGSLKGTTTCQLHMYNFSSGEELYIEPYRAKAFPVIKDLVVDRSAFDRIIQAGGYVSVNTGGIPDGNSIPINHDTAETAFESAACIGCGACVASCPNAAAMLFTSAKVSHLALLPQGKVERAARVQRMVHQMDTEGFGMCSNVGACEAQCPKEISLTNIARMNREYLGAAFTADIDAA